MAKPFTVFDPVVGDRVISNALLQSTPSSPTAPASTSAFTMQGLAGIITPSKSGTVLIEIGGYFISSSGTAGVGIQTQISYGTGAAPANGAALVGTQVGSVLKSINGAALTAADVAVPFSMCVLVTGLTIGVPYWIDLAAEAIATVSVYGIAGVSLTAVEI